MTIISGHNLTKTYTTDGERNTVLRTVNIEVSAGQFAVIQGRSGAGKTTLLNILSGLDEPTEGHVTLLNQRLSELKGKVRQRFINRQIGFVFQFYHLINDLTALENIMLPAQLSGFLTTQAARTRAMALLDEMGLSARQQAYPNHLSGGEQQRVAIARALLNDPQVIFCDEPTGNLDSQTGESVLTMLLKLAQDRHKTVLIVTHDDKIARKAEVCYHLTDGHWETDLAQKS